MGDIIMRIERRPCLVKGEKAMFHKWIEAEDGTPFALVETETGDVIGIRYTHVKFLDHSEFYEYDWSDDKKKGDIQKFLNNLLEEHPVEVKGAKDE